VELEKKTLTIVILFKRGEASIYKVKIIMVSPRNI
jgi:hypothetical protein